MSSPAKNKPKLQTPINSPQLSLAPATEGADHPLTELARLLARRAARQWHEQLIKERRNGRS